jgi:hypothetical protein
VNEDFKIFWLKKYTAYLEIKNVTALELNKDYEMNVINTAFDETGKVVSIERGIGVAFPNRSYVLYYDGSQIETQFIETKVVDNVPDELKDVATLHYFKSKNLPFKKLYFGERSFKKAKQQNAPIAFDFSVEDE